MEILRRFGGERGTERFLVVTVIAGSALALPGWAHGQVLRRLSAEVELGAGTMLTGSRVDLYGVGGAASLRVGLDVVGPLSVHVLGSTWLWTAQPQSLDPGRLDVLGGGVRLATNRARVGRFYADVEGGFSVTGPNPLSFSRVFVSAGVGWALPLGRSVDVGPVVRFGQVIEPDSSPASEDVRFWSAGLTLALHAPTPAPARPAPLRVEPAPAPPAALAPPPPPPDSDGDGVVDPSDRCPAQPEDRDGVEDEDGCLDADDTDADGLLDAVDRCPTAPETVNQFEDDDGCPDTPPPPRVTLEQGRIEIEQVVHFDHDNATLSSRWTPTLLRVAQLLREHPELLRIRVEGHADERGTPEYNYDLSRRRARAVVAFLREHGVSPRRLAYEGYGAARPVTVGSSEDSFAQNRRVDFVIIARGRAPRAVRPARRATR